MATVTVYTPAGAEAGTMELAQEVFGLEPNMALIHQSVVTTLANKRQGTADTKTRSEVKHTTRKLFRQKGTGRARQGMRSAPHWKGGGVAFGPHPRDYSLSLNKKMRRKALLCALSGKLADGEVLVVETFGMEQPKTKQAAALLKALNIADKKVMVVVHNEPDSVWLSFQNLPNVELIPAEMLGTYDILRVDYLLFSRAGIEFLQALKQEPLGADRWLAKQQGGAE